MMHVEFDLPEPRREAGPPVVLCIGNFDGVHRGHHRLLGAAIDRAREIGGESVALTFEPHPRCVLRPDDCPASLTTLDEKRERLAAAGIDRLIVVTFTRQLSRLGADAFCQRLVDGLNLKHLVVGHDFALGHNRQGDVEFLRDFGDTHGFDVTSVHPLAESSRPVSSSRIRAALIEGRISAANRRLGYPYFIDAYVEPGEHVGASLGFPTANLSITPNKCLPQRGIYAGFAKVGEAWHMAAVNIGYRPTFGGDRLVVEAHLLDFDADIYHQRLRLAFVERLREERTYPDATALVEQLRRDVVKTRELLGTLPPPVGL